MFYKTYMMVFWKNKTPPQYFSLFPTIFLTQIQITRPLEIMSPQEYALYRAARVRAEAGDQGGLVGNVPFPGQPSAWELIANPTGTNIDTDPIKFLETQYGMTNYEGTNWVDLISRNAQKNFYDLSFSGATEGGTSYFGSLGYANEQGLIINSGFTRLSGLLNLALSFFERCPIVTRFNTIC